MKATLIVLYAAATLAAFTGQANAWAHNPTWVDNPDIANCTLMGPNSYENNPSCETFMRFGAPASIIGDGGYSSGGGSCQICNVEDLLLQECCVAQPE